MQSDDEGRRNGHLTYATVAEMVVPEQLCRNAVPAQLFLCRGTLFSFAAQKTVPARFFVFR
jgi:hypothetical protein